MEAAEEGPHGENCNQPDNKNSEMDTNIRDLIRQRRNVMASDIPTESKKKQRVELGKTIQKLIRERRAADKLSKISSILADFRGINRVADISRAQKKSSTD